MEEKKYAILHVDKLHKSKDMIYRFNHNSRKYGFITENVDPERTKDNVELIENYGGENYYELYKKEIKKSSYYKTHKVRSDAVRGFEIMLTMSKDMAGKVNIKDWADENVAWLKERFGKDNVKSAVLHMDEGTEHIHAFVVPMTEDGRLCAKEFINGPNDMRKMQDEYAKRMQVFGLERGIKGTHISQKDLKRFYGAVKQDIDYELPHPEKKLGIPESAEHYRERVNKIFQDLKLKITGLELENSRYSSIVESVKRKDRYYDTIKENLSIEMSDRSEQEMIREKQANNWVILENAVKNCEDRKQAEGFREQLNQMMKAEIVRMKKDKKKTKDRQEGGNKNVGN